VGRVLRKRRGALYSGTKLKEKSSLGKKRTRSSIGHPLIDSEKKRGGTDRGTLKKSTAYSRAGGLKMAAWGANCENKGGRLGRVKKHNSWKGEDDQPCMGNKKEK